MSLAVNVESTVGVCVCFWLSARVTGPAYISVLIHLFVCAWEHVCVIAGGVYECLSCVFVLLLNRVSSCRSDCESMGTDISVGGREVNRQAAGYPITLGVLLHPLP